MPSSDNDNTSIVLILGAILLLSLFYLFSGGQQIHNEGTLQMKKNVNSNKQEYDSESDMSNNSDYSNDSNESDNSDDSDDSDDSITMDQYTTYNNLRNRKNNDNDSSDSSLEIIRERAMGLNGPYYRRNNDNKYKHNSYRALGADKDLRKIDRQFKIDDVTKNYTDRFVPMDENEGDQAPVNIKNIKGTEKDKYNSNFFLPQQPQQKEKDWFETIETVDVKNSHLINIYRPIGANTIGSSHKGAIYDLRGLDKAVCPKFVVSPFLQSSWEPDRSSKSLCS
jgi:hypothetical protein